MPPIHHHKIIILKFAYFISIPVVDLRRQSYLHHRFNDSLIVTQGYSLLNSLTSSTLMYHIKHVPEMALMHGITNT
jgi:hypothetical protein